MTMKVTDSSFEQEVLKATLPVIVDFWAEWCGPCKMLSPIIDDLAKELEGKVKIMKMNVDENPHTPSSLGIRGIPTLLLFKDGQQLAAKVGALPKASLLEWINSSI